MRWTVAASLISAALGAWSPFPVPVATTATTAPLGFSYVPLNGGGYAVGSASTAALGWLSESGVWTRVWTDTDAAFATYNTIWSVKFAEELDLGTSSDGALLLTRVDFVGGRSAVTVVNPYTWTTVWSVVLNGTGIAVDIDASSSEQIFVTNGLGGVWTFDFDYTAAPVITDVYYGVNAVLAPTTTGTFALGAGGVVAIDSSTALISIVEPGVSKSRFYCLDSSSFDPNLWTYTPLTWTGAVAAQVDALNFGGALGLVDYEYGTTQVVSFVAAPNAVGTITLLTGSSWCASGATYGLSVWNTSATAPTSYPIAAGNNFVAQTFNCDLNITVALGISFNGLPSFPTTPAVNPYGLYVAAGNLPFTAANGFTPGWDCNNAIPVPPSAVVPGNVYDMACYTYSRVLAGSNSGLGYGVWFHVNTTGVTGTWSFTTRTEETNFDNYLEFYSACPTTCDDLPSGYDTYINGRDDNDYPSEPNCGASSNGYCSAYQFDLTATPRDNIYVVMKFLSSPTPGASTPLYTSSFQVIPDGTNTFNGVPFPTQVCDPRITVPAPPAAPASSAAGSDADAGSDSGSLLSLF